MAVTQMVASARSPGRASFAARESQPVQLFRGLIIALPLAIILWLALAMLFLQFS
jgi:hypothetical protein